MKERRQFSGQHNASKTHCLRGHPLSGSNVTIRYREKDGCAFVERRCNACRAYHARGNNVRRGRR